MKILKKIWNFIKTQHRRRKFKKKMKKMNELKKKDPFIYK